MKATRINVTNAIGATVAVMAALALGGCATTSGPALGGGGTAGAQSAYQNVYAGYGVVNSVEHLQQEPGGIAGSGIGVGAVDLAVGQWLRGEQA